MAITRKLVAQDIAEDNQILKMDNLTRYIVNDGTIWQFLFNTNSAFTNSSQVLKLAGEFDVSSADNVRIIGYLYNPTNGTIDNSASCVFKIYNVATTLNPQWDDQLLFTTSGTLMPNGYYFATIALNSLPGTFLDGNTTLMVEGTAIRLGRTYRDRIYINHLGIYDNVDRLRKDVEFLDITKLDE